MKTLKINDKVILRNGNVDNQRIMTVFDTSNSTDKVMCFWVEDDKNVTGLFPSNSLRKADDKFIKTLKIKKF